MGEVVLLIIYVDQTDNFNEIESISGIISNKKFSWPTV